MSKYDLAFGMCIGAHEGIGQKRKYTSEHYWNHPIEVSQIVESIPHTEEMLIAALGHDQLEDTKMTPKTIEMLFGTVVLELILGLTDISKPEDGNRAVRKEIDRQHTARQSPACKTIKLADLISNSKSYRCISKIVICFYELSRVEPLMFHSNSSEITRNDF